MTTELGMLIFMVCWTVFSNVIFYRLGKKHGAELQAMKQDDRKHL